MRSGSPVRAPTTRPARALAALEFGSARMMAELRRVLKDPADVEAVHRARVALRRFLAAGELWAGEIDGWGALEERVSRLIRKLGRVRNLDVSLELLRKGPVAERKARVALARLLKRRRKKELARLSRRLKARRVERLAARFGTLRTALASSEPAALPGPSSLRPYFERLSRLAEVLGSEEDVEAGHEARRELRRLRYAHEMLSASYDSEQFSGDAERFRAVQQVAGAWHDLCILEAQAVKAERKGRAAGTLRPLLERVREESRTKLEEFVNALGDLEGHRLRLTAEEPE